MERIVIAHDGIAVIVHPTNPVRTITIEQLQGIFSGRIRSWSHLGWGHKPIFFVTREEGSGTRDAFEHLVMGKMEISDEALVQDSNGSVREIIANNTRAIGYISFGVVNAQVKALAVNAVTPNHDTIKSKQYKLTRPFLFVTLPRASDLSRKFIDFVLGADGQRILEHDERSRKPSPPADPRFTFQGVDGPECAEHGYLEIAPSHPVQLMLRPAMRYRVPETQFPLWC